MSYVINADEDSDYLKHYGKPRKSGRYPWGSGEDPYQSMKSFAETATRLEKEGMSQKDVAEYFGFRTTGELRDFKSIARTRVKQENVSRVERLKERGWSNMAISRELGISEPQVRELQKPGAKRRQEQLDNTISTLKAQADSKLYLDVGAGTESAMMVTDGVKKKAIRSLMVDGYETHVVKIPQVGTGELTSTLVLAPPGVTWDEVRQNADKIAPFSGSVDDNAKNGDSGFVKPLGVDPKRVAVNYGGEGGEKADGVIYVRPGVDDVSLGANTYAQVRIQVGDSNYLKGMAVYKDDLPDGVDLVFNTEKSREVGKLGTMKKLNTNDKGEVDWDNPFGSTIKEQIKENGKAISAMNIVNDEDNWDSWSKSLSSQFLSKQSLPLARTQLELTAAEKKAELDEILSLTNPVVRKHMLLKYSEATDASAEHLKAAQLPRQKTHVIMPINSLKTTEVFAPNFENGERVVLIRYPHGGTFEIPELTVNNRNTEANKMLGEQSKTAIGIHHKVAARLSGADFDGDTVVVIPNNSGRIKSKSPLKELESFDPHTKYGLPVGVSKKDAPFPVLAKKNVGMEMGKISNLVTDMTIKGADDSEIARAVKHSMVVIDAEKHGLDYKRSAEDNGIAALKKRYQSGSKSASGGADTLISKASSEARVLQRVDRKASDGGPIDLKTGERVYTQTGKMKRRKMPDGTWVETDTPLTTKTTKMAVTKDARTLSSGSPMESLYADHANEMKGLANRARLEYAKTPNLKYDKEAKAKYQKEVDSLDNALRIANANAPKERAAQRLANTLVKQKQEDNPQLESEDLRKIKGQALNTARDRTGASKSRIEPSDREWEAIQAGAISDYKLTQILRNGNADRIRELATPRKTNELSKSQVSMVRALAASGYTQADIAARLGVSTSTVNNYT